MTVWKAKLVVQVPVAAQPVVGSYQPVRVTKNH